jgi:hypothetical protein
MTVRQLLSLPPERLAKLSVEALKNLPHPVMLAVQQRLDNAGFHTSEAAARHPTPMLPLKEIPVTVCQQQKPGSKGSSKAQKATGKVQKKQQAPKVPPCVVILPGGSTVHTRAWRYGVSQPKAVKGKPPAVNVQVKLVSRLSASSCKQQGQGHALHSATGHMSHCSGLSGIAAAVACVQSTV